MNTGNNLTQASAQWRDRPADERFWTLRELREACAASRAGCIERRHPFESLKATAIGDDLALTGPRAERPAYLTHYAFDQLCSTIQAPAGYVRGLPIDIACGAVNAGLAKTAAKGLGMRDMLFHANGRLTLRAMLSERYDRVWDEDVALAAERLGEAGWRPPAGRAFGHADPRNRPALESDILPGQINIKAGDMITPSGLYASDHDLFVFLVAPDRVISDGRGGALMRGVFIKNSEVGDAALSMTFFLMQAVCGNHIVWNASGVHEIRLRHVGSNTARKAFRQFETSLRTYHNAAGAEEGRIAAAQNKILGGSKEEVLNELVKYCKAHSVDLSRARLAEGYETAEEHEDWYGNPRSLWANVAGLTHASQKTKYADDRNNVDRAAGRLMAMVDGF